MDNISSVEKRHIAKQKKFPRWKGVNLLGMFCSPQSVFYNIDAVKSKNDADDYKIIADLGMDFVRIPCSYRVWSTVDNPTIMSSKEMIQLDDMIDNCLKNNLHANICMHRLYGYCINNDEPTSEPNDLFTSEEAISIATEQWKAIAKRYKEVSAEKLSFNIVNEPPDNITMIQYQKLIDSIISSVRSISPDRMFIIDGLHCGNIPPIYSMQETENCGFSCRGYLPGEITHYKVCADKEYSTPIWPYMHEKEKIYSCENLEDYFNLWASVAESLKVGIHCGEMGCYFETPHKVYLKWLEDMLSVLKSHNIGYAFWNFNGNFGIADSRRTDAEYIKIGKRMLDKKVIELIKKY